MTHGLPITGRKIRFAIVGCGRIAANHFNALAQHAERAELVAVCDIDPKALASAVEKTKAKGYPTLEALLAESNADAVVLCTPSGLHAAQGIKVAVAGKHAITEKPMAT